MTLLADWGVRVWLSVGGWVLLMCVRTSRALVASLQTIVLGLKPRRLRQEFPLNDWVGNSDGDNKA